MNTLAVRYCQLHQIRPEYFTRHLLLRSLYPRARWLHLILERIPNYFVPDRELIEAVGRLEDVADFGAEVAEFHYHPANLGRLRRDWHLRVSVTRLQRIVEATLQGETAAVESRPPFARDAWDSADGPQEHAWGLLSLFRHGRHDSRHRHA